MDDNVQNGLQPEQWLPVFEKGEKRANSLGGGAFRFIRTRSSIRRELKRQCNRSKNGDTTMVHDASNGGSGGGFGKWLRDHLGGGSKGAQDAPSPLKANGNVVEGSGNEKPFGRSVYTSQNLYCSLPREHSRHAYNGARKTGHGNPPKLQGHDRQRSSSVNHQEKTTLSDLGTLTRGGPIYGSEGKTPKKRNRDRRRHSLNETHEQGRQRRRSFRFDVFSVADDGKDIDGFEGESGEGEGEEEETREQTEKDKSTDEEAAWNVASDRSDEGEKYGEAFHEEEEVGEAEEEIPLSPTVSTAEKLEEEVRQAEESDHVLPEIPAEVSADREAIINRLKELLSEQSELRRKNRLLELWVTRHMKKTQQRMTPSDLTKNAEQMEQIYKEVLRMYKMQVDDMVTQEAELTLELQNYTQKVELIREENENTFGKYLDREREVAVDLIFAKTGKKITEKLMNALIHRQMTRTQILARDRQSYILLEHRLEDLHARLRSVETLGEGMTTMDYEVLHVANIGYKDRLDERNQELEKLRLKIADTVNGVAHYKEKEVCIVEDIENEERKLKDYNVENTRAREQMNKLHVLLNELRDTFNEKKIEAGLLVAQQELLEMERMMKLRDGLKNSIEAIQQEIQGYVPVKQKLKKRTQSMNVSIASEDMDYV